MRKSTWGEKPLFLRIVYILGIISTAYITVLFAWDIIKSTITRQIINILSEIEALTLSGFLLKLTLSINLILMYGFGILTICAFITWVYRKIFKINCYKIDKFQGKTLTKLVIAMLLNGAVLIIITFMKFGGLIATISNQALSDSTAGPLIFAISVPLLIITCFICLLAELALEVMIPFFYRWSIQMIKFINSAKIDK